MEPIHTEIELNNLIVTTKQIDRLPAKPRKIDISVFRNLKTEPYPRQPADGGMGQGNGLRGLKMGEGDAGALRDAIDDLTREGAIGRGLGLITQYNRVVQSSEKSPYYPVNT